MTKFQNDCAKAALLCLSLVGAVPLSGCGGDEQPPLPSADKLKNVPVVEPPDTPEGGKTEVPR